MRRPVRALLGAALLGSLSACAGYHTVPPLDYTLPAEKPFERIAFDQAGDPYPASNDTSGLVIPPQPPNRNKAFTLRAHYQKQGKVYDREPIVDRAAARIIAGMNAARARRLVFMIKGFNNSYEAFRGEYEWMRAALATHPAESLYIVEVYWDAIFKGKGTAPMPTAYFADSMTYSNHAGDCGLRDVLRRLPAGTDVTFLTHSRGAAVALSALADPRYDPGISDNCGSSAPGHALPAQLGDVRLVAFAPAIGGGHIGMDNEPARTGLFDHLDRFYVGFNPNDPAVTKKYFGINLSDKTGGDTRLGGNEAYVRTMDRRFAEAGFADAFQAERFDRHSHDWADYLALWRQAHCLLWAGKLIAEAPQGCEVTR